MKKFFVIISLAMWSSLGFANECLRVYKEGQAHWMTARKLDDLYTKNAEAFVKGTQTCEGLIKVINENVDVQEELSRAHGRFMTAELEYCVEAKMPGYANSAKLKQRTIRDRLEELQYVYGELRREAVRAYCIKD